MQERIQLITPSTTALVTDMYWIHGGNCARNEPVTPKEEIDIEELGWQGTSDGERILDKLNDLKHKELTFDLIP